MEERVEEQGVEEPDENYGLGAIHTTTSSALPSNPSPPFSRRHLSTVTLRMETSEAREKLS